MQYSLFAYFNIFGDFEGVQNQPSEGAGEIPGVFKIPGIWSYSLFPSRAVELAVHRPGDKKEPDGGDQNDEGREGKEGAGRETELRATRRKLLSPGSEVVHVQMSKPDVDHVGQSGGHQEAGGHKALEVFGSGSVSELQSGPIHEDLGNRQDEIGSNRPGERDFYFTPGDKKTGDRHQTAGNYLQQEAGEHFVAGGQHARVGIDLLEQPTEKWGEDHDGPGIDRLQLVWGETQWLVVPGQPGREIDMIPDEKNPERVMMFVGDPEEYDEEENPEKFFEDSISFVALFGG